MAYKIGGKNILDLVELPYDSDPRSTSTFSDSHYKRAGVGWSQSVITYKGASATYPYIERVEQYKHGNWYFLCGKGTRPAVTYRGNITNTSGVVSRDSTTGAVMYTHTGGTSYVLIPADLKAKWFIMDIVGGGGGGAGSNSNSGGGGGAGAYALCLLRSTVNWGIVLGGGGSGGATYNSGTAGGASYIKHLTATGTNCVTCPGGSPGTISTGGSGGATASVNKPDWLNTSYTMGHCFYVTNGGRGGDKLSDGAAKTCDITFPIPEKTRSIYTVWGGLSGTGSGGGGAASAVGAGGNGGRTGEGLGGKSGTYGSGGGGARYDSWGAPGGNGGNGYASFYY